MSLTIASNPPGSAFVPTAASAPFGRDLVAFAPAIPLAAGAVAAVGAALLACGAAFYAAKTPAEKEKAFTDLSLTLKANLVSFNLEL